MTEFAKISRSKLIRISRETMALVLAAGIVTCALAYAHHARSGAEPTSQREQAASKEWVGNLPAAAPLPAASSASEPMTSASLVVAPSELPQVISVPRQPAKLRACDLPPCAVKTAVPTPPLRPQPATAAAIPSPQADSPKPTLVAKLNPFNHLPDTTTLTQPFTYVGDKVAGWFHHP